MAQIERGVFSEGVFVMKAVRFHDYGGVDQLKYEDVPIPEPGPDEVQIKVAATSVNPIDFKLRSGAAKGRIPLQLPAIPGRDVAGTVTKVGSAVRNPTVGQKVMGLVWNGYAEYIVAKADILTVIPDNLALEDAAALPLVTTTGGELIQRMPMRRGDLILVTGAVGSVGRAAVFMAGHQGIRVIAGVRASQKADAALLGVEGVVAIDDDAEIAALPELDGIADTVGHEVIDKLIPKIKDGGVLGSVFFRPASAETKNLRVEALMASPNASLLRQMADAVRDGKLVIPIAKRMKLSEAAEAQAMAEKGGVNGKILLIP